jgi:hypothetical protein
MTTDDPLDFTMRKMNQVMDEIEQMLEQGPANAGPYR